MVCDHMAAPYYYTASVKDNAPGQRIHARATTTLREEDVWIVKPDVQPWVMMLIAPERLEHTSWKQTAKLHFVVRTENFNKCNLTSS